MSENERTLDEIVRQTKILGAAVFITILLIAAGGTMAYDAPEPTVVMSQDEFTVANSSDGTEFVTTYEVEYETTSQLTDEQATAATDEMDRVAACTNEAIDTHIQNHEYSEVNSTNWDEVVSDCETDNTNVSGIDE